MASFSKKVSGNPVLISIVIIVIGIFSYLNETTFIEFMEKKTIDLRFRSRGGIPTGSKVVLAVIDEKSLDNEGKWVWPRSKIAALITKLSHAGAKVVAFDIVFSEPAGSEALQTINTIKKKLGDLNIKNNDLDGYLENIKQSTDNDKILAEAIKHSDAKIVLGYFFKMEMGVDLSLNHTIDEKEIALRQDNSRSAKYSYFSYTSEDAQNTPIREAKLPETNISLISNNVDYSGYFNMIPDQDGAVRWIPAVIKFKDALYAPLSIKAVQAYFDESLSIDIADYGIYSLSIGDTMVPTNERGEIMINYRGDSNTFPHISITDILNDNVSENIFKDKIVIVGATAVGIYDLRVTPFSEVFPGVEIHANIVDSILSKDFIYKPEYGKMFDILSIILAGLLLTIILPKTSAVSGASFGIAVFIGYIIFCQYLFGTLGWVLNLVYPLCVMVSVYVTNTAYRYLVEEQQKRFIKNAFSTYLAPSVVKDLMESPEKLNLGGEQREITAFFSDLQGFTGISEQLSPHDLVALLNEFLTEMTDIILKYEGTVDKFEGDAIIAFFGAPTDMKDHAEKACMACVEMQERLKELRKKWHETGKPELKMRIGLHSGPAVVGNMGSKSRMDYTMMGDTVNTAARLECVNKTYGIYTLIGETTHQSLENGLKTREIDSINVVGKNQPIAIYQLLNYSEKINDKLKLTIDSYAKGLQVYRQQNWDEAITCFEHALEITPDDGPSITMLDRCKEYKTHPPEKEWNGVFTLTSK